MTCKKECMEQKKDGTLKDCELAKENEQLKAEIENLKKAYRKQRNKRIDDLQKENEQLKKEISVLLSCKNCPENKGGYICDKEYNDKCLAQKIEYIKELEEQIEKMKSDVQELSNNKYYYLSQHTCKELLRRWN